MGLEMYLYRAQKPSLEVNKVYHYDELEKAGYYVFDANPDGTIPEYIKDLKPFLLKVRCVASYYNLDKVAETFGFDAGANLCGCGPDGVYFANGNSENHQQVIIPREQMPDFTDEKENTFYVTLLRRVMYWYKHYELDDKLMHHFACTRGMSAETHAYFRMTKAAMRIVKNYIKKCYIKEYGTEPKDYNPDDIRSLFYHQN